MPRALRAAVCYAIVLATGLSLSARGHRPAAAGGRSLPAIAASFAPAVPPDRAVFRLGDAAAPFGWSTVIADFDTDGRPDVAVADRVAPRGYRLEFSIAGQAPRDVIFESSQDAVTLSVADVDRDNDLDVIVETPISGQTLGVWLNDGHGHFTPGDLRDLPATVHASHAFETTAPAAHVVALDWPPRPADDELPAAGRAIAPPLTQRAVASGATSLHFELRLDRSTPRAPPAVPPAVLS